MSENVYNKLQAARISLQGQQMSKSGKNKFAGYAYFELGDFLPAANKVLFDKGLFSRVFFSKKYAYLVIYNTEKPEEKIVFTSPMADANLKGCHPIQNVGAVQTYQRRYLYMLALEIVEHDVLDATTGQEASAKPKEQLLADLFNIGRKVMIDQELKNYVFEKYQVSSSKELTVTQIKDLIEDLKKRGDK